MRFQKNHMYNILLGWVLIAHDSRLSQATEQPRFVGFAYSSVNQSAQHNCLLMSTVSSEGYTGHMDKHKGWVPPDPDSATSALINSTMAMPVGRRAIRAWDLYKNASSHLDDNILPPTANCSGKWPDSKTFSGVWWPHGAAEVAALHASVLAPFKTKGGTVDFWAVDDESSGVMHSWWIAKGPTDECGKAKWTAIQEDARFPALLTLLQQLGFGHPDMTKPNWLFDFMTCCGGDLNLSHQRAWNAATSYYFSHWINIGQASVVQKFFPNAVFTEYGSEVPGWRKFCSPGTTGFMDNNVSIPLASNTPSSKVAPLPAYVQSPPLYMDTTSGLAKTLASQFHVTPYPNTPFNAFRQAVNRLRSGVLGVIEINQSHIEMVPYLSYKSYKPSITNSSDDYEEFIIHAALGGVDRFLLWNTHAVLDDNPTISRTLDEIEMVVGRAQGKGSRSWVNTKLANWSTGYVLTASQINNTNYCVWRFTPDMTNFQPTDNVSQFIVSHTGDGNVTLSGMLSQAGKKETVSFPHALVVTAPLQKKAAGGIWISQHLPPTTIVNVKEANHRGSNFQFEIGQACIAQFN